MQNFNMSFSNNRADVLIHLTQWQYWWWFWFTFLWALYYLLVARVFRYRTLKFNPRIASTLRPHGKWGDLLTCIIPVTWCLNILVNSNFILKLIEWQSESSLFTLRVRAKQWYWIYKLDLRNVADIFSTPRNLGRNKWQFATFGDLQTAEDYLHIMQMRAYSSWSRTFWTELEKKTIKKNRFNVVTGLDTYKAEFLKNANLTLYRNIFDKSNFFFNFQSRLNIREVLGDCKLNDFSKSNIKENVFLQNVDLGYYQNSNKTTIDFFQLTVPGKKLHFTLTGDLNKSIIFSRMQKTFDKFKTLKIINNKSVNIEHKSVKHNSNILHSNPLNTIELLARISKKNYKSYSKTQILPNNFLYLNLPNKLFCEDNNGVFLNIKPFMRREPDIEEPTSQDPNSQELNSRQLNFSKGKLIPNLDEFVFVKTFESSNIRGFNNFFEKKILNTYNTVNAQHPDFDEDTRIIRKVMGKNTPFRVLKCPSTDTFFKDFIGGKKVIELFRFRFNEQNPTIANKPIRPTVYLTFKQKRYNQRLNIGAKSQMFLDKFTNQNQTYSGNPFLKDAGIVEENFGSPTQQYRMVKKAKSRLDSTRVASWNRLLRSRRVLVLPAHVNITVITNSFDVVHSWHIPGLGLKMDCLPGRATHHTMYIDNVGLYYGQCAEVCGRYHHHMPIRVCALPFEHFLVWWHTFGLPKFLFPLQEEEKYKHIPISKYFTRKFSW